MDDKSNDPNWRRFMDQKWREIEEQKKQTETSSDYLIRHASRSSFNPLSIDPKRDTERFKENQKDLKKLDKRQEIRTKHTKDYVKSIASGSINQMSARRKELQKKPQLSEAEHKEYFEVNKKLDQEVIERQKKWDEDMKDL